MQLQYNGRPNVNLLTLPANFLTASRATALGGHYTYSRSTELAGIDTALNNFQLHPDGVRLTALTTSINTWLRAKAGRYNAGTGAITSKRAGAVTTLRQELANLTTLHNETATAMARVEQALDALDWRRKCLCAELYDANLNLGGVDGCKQDMAEESNFS